MNLGGSNIVFSGITFEGAVGPIFYVNRGQSNLIFNCVLNGSSQDGVDLMTSLGCGVSRCTIANMGGMGIFVYDGNQTSDRIALSAATNFATLNTIDMSRLCWTVNPGISIQGVGNYLAHNLIYNRPHEAIQVLGNNHVIEYNEIHHVCQQTSDAGAVYLGNVDWTMRGNVFRYNYVHDVNKSSSIIDPSAISSGRTGVYMDDFWSGTAVQGTYSAPWTMA